MQQNVYGRHIRNEKKHWWFSARREIIFSIIEKFIDKRNLKILDFGSGSGTNVLMLNKFGKVDILETNYEARTNLKKKFNNRKKYKIINKLSKSKYDLIIAADVVEHIKDDKKIIKNLSKHLKKNGHILITVPAFNFLFSSKDIALKHFRRYKKNNLKKLLKNHFVIKKISYFNFFLFIPIVVSILFLKIRKKKYIKFAETTPTTLLNLFLFKVFNLEKIFLKFLNFPFGISIIVLAKKNG